MIHSTAEAEAPNPQPVPVQYKVDTRAVNEISQQFFYNLQRRSLAENHTEHAFKHGVVSTAEFG